MIFGRFAPAVAAASAAARIIAAPPAAWTLTIDDAERQHGANAAGDRVRDVVQLQIGEDRQADFGDGAHALRSVGVEEFEPDLQAADIGLDGARPRQSFGDVGGIEGAEDGVLAAAVMLRRL